MRTVSKIHRLFLFGLKNVGFFLPSCADDSRVDSFKGWVNTLVGGQKEGARGFMFFIINVDLTEEGLCEYP